MPLKSLGDYRYLDGRTVVQGLPPELEGHVATRWLPPHIALTLQQMNECVPHITHGNAPLREPDYR